MRYFPEEVLDIIRKKASELDYGKIIIEVSVSEGGSYVDVAFKYEDTKRVYKNSSRPSAGQPAHRVKVFRASLANPGKAVKEDTSIKG